MDNLDWPGIWKAITEITSVVTAVVGVFVAYRLYLLSKKVREDSLDKVRLGIVRSKHFYDNDTQMGDIEISIVASCGQPVFIKSVAIEYQDKAQTHILWNEKILIPRIPLFEEARSLGPVTVKLTTLDEAEYCVHSGSNDRNVSRTFILQE